MPNGMPMDTAKQHGYSDQPEVLEGQRQDLRLILPDELQGAHLPPDSL